MKGCGLIRKRRACLESKRERERGERERGREGGREWGRLYLAIGLSQCYRGFKFHAFCDFSFSHKNLSQIIYCMQTNFGGHGHSGFGDFASLQKRPNFPFGPWTIVHGSQKI